MSERENSLEQSLLLFIGLLDSFQHAKLDNKSANNNTLLKNKS